MIAIAATLTHIGRQHKSSRDRKRFDRRFATVLYLVCLIIFLRDLRPDRIGWSYSLPLHICDVTGLMAAIAIQTRNPIARRILHFWGLALSSQAFLFPVLNAGPIHSDFWLYWIEHGAIVVAALYDLTVNNYRPDWRDWRLAVLYLAAYAAIILPIDAMFNLNYGYLGRTLVAQRSAIAALGPWPNRIPTIWLACVATMSLLRLRWPARTKPNNAVDHPPIKIAWQHDHTQTLTAA